MNSGLSKKKKATKYKIRNISTNEICKNSKGLENYALSEGWAHILLARYCVEMPNEKFEIVKVKEYV
mgnify:CR=1 FL=1